MNSFKILPLLLAFGGGGSSTVVPTMTLFGGLFSFAIDSFGNVIPVVTTTRSPASTMPQIPVAPPAIYEKLDEISASLMSLRNNSGAIVRGLFRFCEFKFEARTRFRNDKHLNEKYLNATNDLIATISARFREDLVSHPLALEEEVEARKIFDSDPETILELHQLFDAPSPSSRDNRRSRSFYQIHRAVDLRDSKAMRFAAALPLVNRLLDVLHAIHDVNFSESFPAAIRGDWNERERSATEFLLGIRFDHIAAYGKKAETGADFARASLEIHRRFPKLPAYFRASDVRRVKLLITSLLFDISGPFKSRLKDALTGLERGELPKDAAELRNRNVVRPSDKSEQEFAEQLISDISSYSTPVEQYLAAYPVVRYYFNNVAHLLDGLNKS